MSSQYNEEFYIFHLKSCIHMPTIPERLSFFFFPVPDVYSWVECASVPRQNHCLSSKITPRLDCEVCGAAAAPREHVSSLSV